MALLESCGTKRAPGWRRLMPLALSGVLSAACDGPQSTFAPAGPAARQLVGLSWTLFLSLGFVYVVVLALLAVAVARSRSGRRAPTPDDERRAVAAVLVGGAVVPALVGAALAATTLRGMSALSPGRTADELAVEVVGRQWWWEIHYPDADPGRVVTTANELHIPAGRRVRVRLTSRDVIHSFWVPALHGKMDLIPGRTTEIAFQADHPGAHRGQCAEYCGTQHARMAFWVIVDSPADFEAWLARERRPAEDPADERARRGRAVFVAQSCAGCHSVRGTTIGVGGPDLTHVASRRTLAAGTLDNVPGNLAGWIADPQALKPGNLMPRVPLAAADLHALVAYLGTLR
jgi:cytochrome c oxidase subunit 2